MLRSYEINRRQVIELAGGVEHPILEKNHDQFLIDFFITPFAGNARAHWSQREKVQCYCVRLRSRSDLTLITSTQFLSKTFHRIPPVDGPGQHDR
jgi:hypothetical protein